MHPGNVKAPSFKRVDLPRLELLRTFEAAARTLSFTKAADEMALTQSAVSRQIQQIEADIGVPLFERRHRALVLTDAGAVLHRAVVDSLERLRDATARVRQSIEPRHVSITSTPGFASLWLIPRLARFTESHPDVDVRVSATLDVLDLARSRVDIAVRFVPISAGKGAVLFEESVEPVCAPALVNEGNHPLRRPEDLVHHTLLTIDAPQEMGVTVDWEPWFEIMKLPAFRMKNTLRFTQYTDAVGAALAGQGVVIGRIPLIDPMLRDGRLVAPFGGGAASRRGYFLEMARHAVDNADANDFATWLRTEAEAMLSSRPPALVAAER